MNVYRFIVMVYTQSICVVLVLVLMGCRTVPAQPIITRLLATPPQLAPSLSDAVPRPGNQQLPITYLDLAVKKAIALPESHFPSPTQPTGVTSETDSLDIGKVALPREREESTSQPGMQRVSAKSRMMVNRLREVPSILPFHIAPDPLTGLVRTRLSSGFGLRYHPLLGVPGAHAGIDLPAPLGTLIYATADGVCRQLINQPNGLGLAIYLTHSRGHQTIYGHLLASRIKPGDLVSRGQVIGQVGRSGMTTGAHLHYSVRFKGRVVDPLPYCFLLMNTQIW